MSGKYALIIGNSEYTDLSLAKLTAPGKDAVDFARVLKDRNICAFDDVKVLLNQLSSSVIEAIDEFFDQKKLDDLLVTYFSGHGIRDEGGTLYLAFRNTIRSRLRSTAIKSDYIREAMDQSRSKRQVLILDCCNSGAFPQGTKSEVGGAMGLATAFQGYGRYVLTASDATQFAWEGDKVIGQTENSLFTHFLVKGLKGEADKDGDGKITVDELYDYSFEQISKVTPNQTPTKSSSKAEGEIILRQITRIEDIKFVPLPMEIINAIDSPLPYVREGVVHQLAILLSSKNLGLARSARETLEKIAAEDDSRRVAQTATQVLQSTHQADQEAEEKHKEQTAEPVRKAREETKSPIGQKAKHIIKELQILELHESTNQKETGKLAISPGWISVLWIGLGWTISLVIGRAIALKMIEVINGANSLIISWTTGWVISGLLGGLAIAFFSQKEHVPSNWKRMLWIILGWLLGVAFGMGVSAIVSRASHGIFGWLTIRICTGWLIGGGIGNFTFAIILHIDHVLSNWKQLLWITLGWIISMIIGMLSSVLLGEAVNGTFNEITNMATGVSGVISRGVIFATQNGFMVLTIGLIIGGLINSYILIWQTGTTKTE